jgi:hypothetical protein
VLMQKDFVPSPTTPAQLRCLQQRDPQLYSIPGTPPHTASLPACRRARRQGSKPPPQEYASWWTQYVQSPAWPPVS